MEELFKYLFRKNLDDESDFIADGVSRRQLLDLAARLTTSFTECPPDRAICLAAQGRDVIAAALLAAVATRRVLLLPHSFSAMALRQMQDFTGFDTAIVDVDRPLSHGTKCIWPHDVEKLQPSSLADCSPKPDAELLRLFTGGSTGAANIWSKSIANVFGEAKFITSCHGIKKEDCILATITPYHIYGLLFSVLVPLLSGASVVAESPSFPAEIDDYIQKESVTVLVSVPAHFRALQKRRLAGSLRLAFSSAGMLDIEDNSTFCASNSANIVEVYGSTETGGLATRNRGTGESFFTPLDILEWRITDGRLLVRSPFVSAEVPTGEDGWFLTGDKVREEEGGCFSLHGRADAITKVGGERVDLDEVKDLLMRQRGVSECVVLALEDGGGRGNRIAALLCSDEEELDLRPLKHVLSISLEPAAMPKLFKLVSRIPVKANGKYDRDAIAKLFL